MMAQEPKTFALLSTRIDPTIRADAKRIAAKTGASLAEYVEVALAEHNRRQGRKGV